MVRFRSCRSFLLMLPLALLVLTASRALAVPANDYFFNATDISPLPYHEVVDMTTATTEYLESFYCSYSTQTVWYRFTPATRTWIKVSSLMPSYYSNVTLYRSLGTGLGNLSFLRCASDSMGIIFLAEPGVTYYMQAMAGCCYINGNLYFDVTEITPPAPIADFYYYPPDPSIYDTINFQSNAYDPAGLNIVSWSWDFGDGTVGTGCCPYHQYESDGTYNVTLSVQTSDGRSGTVTRPDSVRTRDVGISGFKTPQNASGGQTKIITVSVTNTRYPELVHVTLEKSAVGGFNPIGYQDQFMPVKKQATDVVFSYTFTAEDARVGKVTFRASAQLYSGHDALPADNVVVSLQTKVNKFGATVADGGDLGASDEIELALSSVTPNPASVGVDLSVRLALPAAGPARLQVIDLAGRVWAERDLGDLGPGVHDTKITWERRPSPGIYWVRLVQRGAAVSRRIALIH